MSNNAAMNLSQSAIDKAASILEELRANNRLADKIEEDCAPSNFATAYAIQDALVQQLLSSNGGEQIGYKIACTNKSAQQLLNLDGPFFGCLLSTKSFPSGVELVASEFAIRCIEAEFAFQIAEDIPAAEHAYTADTISPFIKRFIPSIEIVDTHFSDWTKVGALSLAADNAIHGAWVHGTPIDFDPNIDYSSQETRLFLNDELIRTGGGSEVLGDPLNVVAWLANELPLFGKQLKAKQYATTGITTEVYLADSGDLIRAEFSNLGEVELSFK